jgi:hypothetical protein
MHTQNSMRFFSWKDGSKPTQSKTGCKEHLVVIFLPIKNATFPQHFLSYNVLLIFGLGWQPLRYASATNITYNKKSSFHRVFIGQKRHRALLDIQTKKCRRMNCVADTSLLLLQGVLHLAEVELLAYTRKQLSLNFSNISGSGTVTVVLCYESRSLEPHWCV